MEAFLDSTISAIAGRRLWLAYGAGVAMTTATLALIEFALPRDFAGTPVILFVIPVMLSAYLGGLGPGLASTVLSTTASAYFLAPPTYSWHVASPVNQVKLIALVLAGAVISVLCESMRRAQKRAQVGEEGFRLLVGQVKDYAIIVLDPEGRVMSWNEGAERIKGYVASEIIGRNFACFYTAEDIARNRPQDELSVAARDGRFEDEGWRVRRDQSRFWASVVITPLRDEAGRLRGYAKVTRDVTERKRAEATLKESEERFRLLLDSTAEAIYGLDLEGRCTFCNPAGLRLLGCADPSQVIGKDLHALTHSKHADGTPYPAADCTIHRALGRDEEAHLPDEIFWRADGTSFSVETWSHPIRHGANVVGCVVTFHDTTERMRAEDALRRASAYNRSLIEASLDPLVTISPDGMVTDVNTATEKVTGGSRHELVGTDFSDYFTDPEKARAGYQQVFREGWVQDYELGVRHRDGHITPVLYNASVYRDDAGLVIGVFAAARDITDRKRAEQDLRTLNETLEQRVAQRTGELEASNKETRSLHLFRLARSSGPAAAHRWILTDAGGRGQRWPL